MTQKSKQGGKMMFYIVLCLQMLTAIVKSTRIAVVAEHKNSKNTGVAAEMLDDLKLATMTIDSDSINRQTVVSMRVVGPNDAGCECVLPPSLMPGFPYQLNRVSRKTVVLRVYVFNERIRTIPSTLLLINTETCQLRYAYDGNLPRSKSYIFTSNNSTDERFILIANENEFCGGHDWCRLFFDPIYRRREALDFGFSRVDIRSVEPATESFDAHLFIVKVVDKTNSVLSVRLCDLSSHRRASLYKVLYQVPLKIVPGPNPRTSLVSTSHLMFSAGLSHCLRLVESSSGSRNPVICARFQKDGNLMFNETMQSSGLMINVQTVPNGLVLFSVHLNCLTTRKCTTVQVDVATRDSDSGNKVQIQHHEYELKCRYKESSIRVQLNKATNSIHYLEYLCRDDLSITSRVLYER